MAPFPLADGRRLRVPALLVDLQPLTQLLMDSLHHLHAARVAQGFGQRRLKGKALIGGGHGRFGMEHYVDQLLVSPSGFLA